MQSLREQREETERERARNQAANRGMSAAQEAKKRKMDERRALIESKRAKMMGEGAGEKMRKAKQEAEADRFLRGLEREMSQS